MHLLLILTTLLFPLHITAQNQCTGDKTIQGYCTILSSTDRTSSSTNPPTRSQCEESCRSTLSDAGDWIVDFTGRPAGYIDKMSQSACSFSVGRGEGEPSDYKFYMHNQDIVDIIDDVNQKYAGSHGGKVAAEGTMNCEGHLATWYVN